MADQDRIVEYAPWVDPFKGGPVPQIPTQHLADDVVKQPFLLSLTLDSRTDADNPRSGGCWIALNFNGRKNEALTPDEREYVVALLTAALERL